MKKEEVEHLASLARIKLEESEKESLEKELSSIVEYVSEVSDIAGVDADVEPKVGARYNIFREDKVTNEPDQFTEDIVAEMPAKEGRWMKVKKILKTE